MIQHTEALLSERGRPRPPPSNTRTVPSKLNQDSVRSPDIPPLGKGDRCRMNLMRVTLIDGGRPRTTALRQKSFRVLNYGASVRRSGEIAIALRYGAVILTTSISVTVGSETQYRS